VAYARRNRDLDPQLVWRGKDEQDWSDLVVPAPPLSIQEKVHPKREDVSAAVQQTVVNYIPQHVPTASSGPPLYQRKHPTIYSFA
jgi:hypothetical protein